MNLYLHVVGRRADGLHLLDSLAVFAGAADTLAARADPALRLRLSGPAAPALQDDAAENLVLRAARALRKAHGVAAGAALTLDKHLPVASGIGGGSADAAAALRLLARLWRLPADAAALAGIAQTLGSDVPVCLAGRPARMGGVGERLEPAPALPPFGLLLCNPGVAVSTPAVFRARAPGFTAAATLPAGWADARAMAAALAGLRNDLQEAAVGLCPAIAGALAAVRSAPGCLLARMSGSGATCFGLFATADEAERAARGLAGRPGWWVWGGAPGPDRKVADGVAADVAVGAAAPY